MLINTFLVFACPNKHTPLYIFYTKSKRRLKKIQLEFFIKKTLSLSRAYSRPGELIWGLERGFEAWRADLWSWGFSWGLKELIWGLGGPKWVLTELIWDPDGQWRMYGQKDTPVSYRTWALWGRCPKGNFAIRILLFGTWKSNENYWPFFFGGGASRGSVKVSKSQK